jgi:hypothetical protein
LCFLACSSWGGSSSHGFSLTARASVLTESSPSFGLSVSSSPLVQLLFVLELLPRFVLLVTLLDLLLFLVSYELGAIVISGFQLDCLSICSYCNCCLIWPLRLFKSSGPAIVRTGAVASFCPVGDLARFAFVSGLLGAGGDRHLRVSA